MSRHLAASAPGRGVFIAGTDTGVGKTRVTVALLRALAVHGVAVAAMKPVAAGRVRQGRGRINPDVAAIAAALGIDPRAEPDLCPYALAAAVSPHIAARREGRRIDLARIAAAYRRLSVRAAAIVVEGAGGWLAPIGVRASMADVARQLRLPVVLVVGVRLGCLNHAQLSAQAITASGCRLAGWIGSVTEARMPELDANLATLRRRLPAPQLGLLPFSCDAAVDPARLERAARTLFGPQAPRPARFKSLSL